MQILLTTMVALHKQYRMLRVRLRLTGTLCVISGTKSNSIYKITATKKRKHKQNIPNTTKKNKEDENKQNKQKNKEKQQQRKGK